MAIKRTFNLLGLAINPAAEGNSRKVGERTHLSRSNGNLAGFGFEEEVGVVLHGACAACSDERVSRSETSENVWMCFSWKYFFVKTMSIYS